MFLVTIKLCMHRNNSHLTRFIAILKTPASRFFFLSCLHHAKKSSACTISKFLLSSFECGIYKKKFMLAWAFCFIIRGEWSWFEMVRKAQSFVSSYTCDAKDPPRGCINWGKRKFCSYKIENKSLPIEYCSGKYSWVWTAAVCARFIVFTLNLAVERKQPKAYIWIFSHYKAIRNNFKYFMTIFCFISSCNPLAVCFEDYINKGKSSRASNSFVKVEKSSEAIKKLLPTCHAVLVAEKI